MLDQDRTGIAIVDAILFIIWCVFWITGTTIDVLKDFDIFLAPVVKLFQIASFTIGGLAAIASFSPSFKKKLCNLFKCKQ